MYRTWIDASMYVLSSTIDVSQISKISKRIAGSRFGYFILPASEIRALNREQCLQKARDAQMGQETADRAGS